MTANSNVARDNLLGLTLLFMLAVALVAAESRQDTHLAGAGRDLPNAASPLIIDDSAVRGITTIRGDIAGAIRELQVRPLSNRVWPDLGWSSDEQLLEEDRRVGF